MSAIAKIYGKNVLSSKKSFEDVPDSIKDDVKEYILSVDPHFFDEDITSENTPPENTSNDTTESPTGGAGSSVTEE